jgi:hypothetical protein
MNAAVVIAFIKKVLPMDRIGAFILGLIGAALALFMGVGSGDLKAAYCKAEAVAIPAIAAPAVEPAK